MPKLFNYFFLIGFFLIVISCKTNETKKNQDLYILNDSTEINNLSLEVSFKDKYFIKNKFGYGQLVYKKAKDTLTKNDIEKKYVIILVSGNKESNDFNSVLKTADDAVFDSINTDIVDFFFKVKFSEIGMQELKIGIKRSIELKRKDTLSEIVELIESDTVVTIPVLVVDSTSTIGYKNDTAYLLGERIIKVKRKDSIRLAKEQEGRFDSVRRVLNN